MKGVPRTDETTDVTAGWNRDGRPPSIAIVETIAAIEGTDPTELEFFLYDFVAPEALDRLFLAEKGGDLAVELRVSDHLVTVRADGSLRLRTVESQSPATSTAETATVADPG
ncbi:MAG: HalOD1 output domain-containing protein [Halobacteriota archaeon]